MPPKKRKDEDGQEKIVKKAKTNANSKDADVDVPKVPKALNGTKESKSKQTHTTTSSTAPSGKPVDEMLLTKMIKTRQALKLKDHAVDSVLRTDASNSSTQALVTFEMENISTFKDILRSLADMCVDVRFLLIAKHMDPDKVERSYLRVSQMDKGNTYLGEMMYEIKNFQRNWRANSLQSRDDANGADDASDAEDLYSADGSIGTKSAGLLGDDNNANHDNKPKTNMQAGYEIAADFTVEILSFKEMFVDVPGDQSVKLSVMSDTCHLSYNTFSNTGIGESTCAVKDSTGCDLVEPDIDEQERFVVLKLSTDFLKKNFNEEKTVYDIGCVLASKQHSVDTQPLIKPTLTNSQTNSNANATDGSTKQDLPTTANDPNEKVRLTQMAIFLLQSKSLETRKGRSQRLTGTYELTKPQSWFQHCNGRDALQSGQGIDPIVFSDQDKMLERRLKQDTLILDDLARNLKSVVNCRVRGEIMKKFFDKVVDSEVLLFIPTVHLQNMLIWRYQLGETMASRASIQYYIPHAEEEPDQM